MARGDLVLKLLRAANAGDRELLQKTTEAVVADERAKGHRVLAEQLQAELRRPRERTAMSGPTVDAQSVERFAFDITPERDLSSVVLTEVNRVLVAELLEEHQRADLLRSYNLEPRHRFLFVGPPGNGKTSLAEALAYELSLPFLVVRYEGLIGSYLGETAIRISQLFEYVRARRCVLFFDEFDAIAKERGDPHDAGEIKRVVSSLLLQIDRLPSYVVVIAATNHPELLDRAVWRRFEARLTLNMPNSAQRSAFLQARLKAQEPAVTASAARLSRSLGALSYSELEQFVLDFKRRLVLRASELTSEDILRDCLQRWRARERAPDPLGT